ncbi:MAG: hypothetical protein GY710_10020 [Desulfobacteraceae bacterium]|nr:hypothetical protein [Desulfobacteraceae bacterium]
MKKFFKFLLLLFLFLLFVLVLAGVGYWALVIKGWPWWICAIIFALAIGIVLGIFAIKKYLVRRNEKKFVKSIVNEEEEFRQKEPDPEQYSLKEMQDQWKVSIGKLKKSYLRKYGNPLYVLPWYIMLGESRSGKTSVIKNSNLSSSLTDVSESTVLSGTKNCDWWFMEQAIVLDTAGRYTIPIEEATDKNEWQHFLRLLAKYRKREPINGVIVTVASNDLLNENVDDLAEKAKSIRQRINQMMRILGAKFPVYLLVTKMDLVNGFTDFCDHIPEQRNVQVMGYSNETGNKNCLQVLEESMDTVYDQIRNLRSLFIHNRINNFAVSFSTEFMKLKSGLESYVKSLFGDDIYQATPLFRGLYFSSACRKGKPDSQFLKQTGIEYSGESSKDRNKGFFLKSFFAALLPMDRNVFTPLSEFLMWRKTTLGLGLFSLSLICLSMSGILCFLYLNNLNALNKFDAHLFQKSFYSTNLTDNILVFDRQGFEINKLESNNSHWIFPRLGLNASLELEQKLKRRFVRDAKRNLIDPLDEQFFKKTNGINLQTDHGDIVAYCVYAIRRIIVLKMAVNKESLSGRKYFEESIAHLLPKLDRTIPFAVASKLASVYYDYLGWNTNHVNRVRELAIFQKQLSEIVDKSGNLHWLLSQWVCTTADIGISDFIQGYSISQTHFSTYFNVKGAFTKMGRDEIKQFIALLRNILPDQQRFKKMENRFWAWYATEFYNAWFEFASKFPRGWQWKLLTENWSDIGTLMTTEQNPYFLLLVKMAEEFEQFKPSKNLVPSWVDTVIRLDKIKELATVETQEKQGSFWAKLKMKTDRFTSGIEEKSKKVYKVMDRKKASEQVYNLKLSKVWNEYLAGLKSIAPATSYNEKCFQMFSSLFKALSDSSKQKNPFSTTYDTLVLLKSFYTQHNIAPFVEGLTRGPYDFLTEYGVYNSIKYLQNKWEEMVLSVSHSVDPINYYSVMFDKNSGVLWKFVNKEAGPFLDQSTIGFFARNGFGLQLPFSNQFFELLNNAKKISLDKQSEYIVTIQTAPISINREAKIKPYSSILTMDCAAKKIELVNNNFTESQKFTWKPATCGDVVLSIEIGDVILTKKYTGKLGFGHFLQDFKDGTKQFSIADFPGQMDYLSNNWVTDISVSYEISGIEPVLKFMDRRSLAIPNIIFRDFQQKRGKYPLDKKALVKTKIYKIPQKDVYNITLETIPMGVNPTARVKPVATILQMTCGGKVILFENNNYPESVTFDWEPSNCGKVVLIIHFPKLTLTREYPDFLAFVQDFNYHSKTFSSDDFPEQKAALLKLDISSITISYGFKGDLPRWELRLKKQNPALEKSVPIQKSASPTEKKDDKIEDKIKKPISSSLGDTHKKKDMVKGDKGAQVSDGREIGSAEWIKKQNPAYYTLHILQDHSKNSIMKFAKVNHFEKDSAIYESVVNGHLKYNLVFGSFDSFASAKKALGGLSAGASRYSPWIRRFSSIVKEMK